jgi:hypothetical protein
MKIAVFWAIALMMEAARTSDTLVNFYQTTRCYNPEDSNLHLLTSFTPILLTLTEHSTYTSVVEEISHAYFISHVCDT